MNDRLKRWGRLALWAIVVYGALLAVSTITHQPDYKTDFPAYARYVTTSQFLFSHLIASIAGAGFGLVGAAGLFILADEVAPRLARWGFVLWAFAQVGLASVFGVAAFFQPAIGRAFLDGGGDVAVAINEDVYGGPLMVMVGLSLLLFIVGGILLGVAASRVLPRWAGLTFAGSVVLFVLTFLLFDVIQPVGGLGIALAGVGFALGARRAPATDADLESRQRRT
jgi:MFS family permease